MGSRFDKFLSILMGCLAIWLVFLAFALSIAFPVYVLWDVTHSG